MSSNGNGRLNATELREALRLARGPISPMSPEAHLLRKVRDALDVEEAAGRHMSRHERRLCELADGLTWVFPDTQHPEYVLVDRVFHDEHTAAMARVAERKVWRQERASDQLIATALCVEAQREHGSIPERLRAQLDAARAARALADDDVSHAIGALLRIEQRRDAARRRAVIDAQSNGKSAK